MESVDPTNWLVPNIVDLYAIEKPDAIYAEFPVSTSTYTNGYRAITYRQLANAANCCAALLSKTRVSSLRGIIPYIGPNDFRYIALVLGAAKIGYAVLEPSQSAFLLTADEFLPADIRTLHFSRHTYSNRTFCEFILQLRTFTKGPAP